MSQAGILSVEGSDPQIPIDFVTDSGTATAIGNTLYIIGGTGISTAAPGNLDTITISASGTGFTWEVITDADNPKQILVNYGYICSGASLCTLILPLTPTIGDMFKVFSYSSRFQIIPNGSQNIVVGAGTGIAGSGGTLTSNSPGDVVTIVYMGNNTFQAEAPQGTLTLVTS